MPARLSALWGWWGGLVALTTGLWAAFGPWGLFAMAAWVPFFWWELHLARLDEPAARELPVSRGCCAWPPCGVTITYGSFCSDQHYALYAVRYSHREADI